MFKNPACKTTFINQLHVIDCSVFWFPSTVCKKPFWWLREVVREPLLTFSWNDRALIQTVGTARLMAPLRSRLSPSWTLSTVNSLPFCITLLQLASFMFGSFFRTKVGICSISQSSCLINFDYLRFHFAIFFFDFV